MKKTILIIAGVILPLSAMAMKPMSETDLSNVCCRSGVSIMVDVTMNIHFGTIAWGDPDGYCSVQTSRKPVNNAADYADDFGSSTSDPSGLPYTVRVNPDTMTLTPDGTEYYLYQDVFKRTTLSKP